MTTWAHSPAYGQSVVLGPTQELVYRFVLDVTADGRRPEFPLARIASAIGRPVSSVHDALGRLRALGLIGYASRMGRTGGTRLWRAAVRLGSVGESGLDVARHRRAVARVLTRFALVVRTEDQTAAESAPTLWSEPDTGVSHPPVSGTPGGTGDEDTPDTVPPVFHDMMRKHGVRPWWKDANRDEPTESQSATDNRSEGSGGTHARESGIRVHT